MEPPALLKYPRTRHVQGSRLQAGDEDLSQVPWSELAPLRLVVEEKLDGANAGISFDRSGRLLVQSRGHYLGGGGRETFWAPLKAWTAASHAQLWDALGTRYVLYGEYLYAKHTEFYDAIAGGYLHAFDVFDRDAEVFLSTRRWRDLLADVPLTPVPVLWDTEVDGPLTSLASLTALVRPSLYKTERWRDALVAAAEVAGVDPALALAETDPSPLAEGLYLKWEDDDTVLGRFKWVRADFCNTIADSGTHWLDRPVIVNGLRAGSDLYDQTPMHVRVSLVGER